MGSVAGQTLEVTRKSSELVLAFAIRTENRSEPQELLRSCTPKAYALLSDELTLEAEKQLEILSLLQSGAPWSFEDLISGAVHPPAAGSAHDAALP